MSEDSTEWEARMNGEIRELLLRVIALERDLKREKGPAAFAAYENAVAAAVEREIKPDTENVVRLRRRRVR